MLREQRVVEETIKYFAKMNYSKDQFKLYIVTTAKEAKQKADKEQLLDSVSELLFKGVTLAELKERYLGLFSSDNLESLHASCSEEDFRTCIDEVKKFYYATPSTYDLAIKTAELVNKVAHANVVNIINYPNVKGEMADQINYCANKVNDILELKDSIFVVYNADSRPNLDTLRFVDQEIFNYKKVNGRVPNIVQQSALFTLNYDKHDTGVRGSFLRAAALFQTKWTLIHELTRFRTQSVSVLKEDKNILQAILHTKLAHCVGHGLFVRLSVFVKRGLPTDTVTEDLQFGFLQCCKGEQILPIPLLENAESPETIASYFNQKKVWFWPYFMYLKLRKKALENKEYRSKAEVDVLTVSGISTGIIWLLQSAIFIIPLIISILLGDVHLVLLWVAGYFIYWIIPIAIIYLNLNQLEKYSANHLSKLSLFDFLKVSIAGLPLIFTYSLGPINCLRSFLNIKFNSGSLVKIKTER